MIKLLISYRIINYEVWFSCMDFNKGWVLYLLQKLNESRSLPLRPDDILDPGQVMRHPGINARYIGRAALTETRDPDHLEEAQIFRMNHLQRTSRVALTSILGPATARITRANHAWRNAVRSLLGTTVSYRTRQIVYQIQLSLLQFVS